MILKLYDFSGEFCSRRTTPGLKELKEQIRLHILNNTPITLSSENVKLITPSYIDELLPSLMVELGKEKVLNLIKFSPPLTGYALEQIERGYTNRRHHS